MDTKEIVIRPKSSWNFIDFAELWRFRELFYVFAWRDIKVRYKQTLLGILWVVFQPLVSTFIFTVFFGNLAKISSGKLPYALFVLAGLVFWNFFSSALSHAATSMVGSANIFQKVYFPKMILPLSAILTSFVDFLINLAMLLLAAIVLGYYPSLSALIIFPMAVVVTAITAAGLGLLLTSINIKYRDVGYILPYFIQLLLFLTPVIYPITILSQSHRFIMALNPMTSVIEASRTVFSGATYDPVYMVVSFISALVILSVGILYFNKTEQFFADIV
ncbi:ABC transporter permease [Patescibacteria group bacterium]|nr:ABC transporter permease [Patescibacteria group bacterium]MCL5798046.1 ABC transporter permease [Patescibacteria group bacterium]